MTTMIRLNIATSLRQLLRPFGAFALLPGVAVAVGLGTAALLEARFDPQTSLWGPRRGQHLTSLFDACVVTRFPIDEPLCVDYASLLLLAAVGLAVALIGLVLFAAIPFVAEFAVAKTRNAYAVFRWTINITLLLAGLVTVVNGVLAFGLVILLSVALRMPSVNVVGLILAIGAVIMAVRTTYWIFVGTYGFARTVFGVPAYRGEQPELWAIVESIAAEYGVRAPDDIVFVAGPSVIVNSMPAETADGRAILTGRTLELSLPAMAVLDETELRIALALVITGAEKISWETMERLEGESVRLGVALDDLYGHVTRSPDAAWKDAMATARTASWGAVAARPILRLLDHVLHQFLDALDRRAWRNAFAVDQLVASRVGPGAVAAVMLKLDEISTLWFNYRDEIAMLKDRPWPNVAAFRAIVAESLDDVPAYERVVLIGQAAAKYDSLHVERLTALGLPAEFDAWRALPWRRIPERPATNLLRDIAEIEQRLGLGERMTAHTMAAEIHPSSNVVTP